MGLNYVIWPNAGSMATHSRYKDTEAIPAFREDKPNVKNEPLASPWCMSPLKRLFDLTLTIPALFLFSFGILAIAVIVRLTSAGPILFRQQRVGLDRKMFTIYKFRTMHHNAASMGPSVTKMGDPRLTVVGRYLRKYKLDELPQLYNVLRGDMSLVGPRPKLSHHEHLGMQYRPGITGAATLAFAKEEFLLETIQEANLEHFHTNVISPLKKLLDSKYHECATFRSDLWLLLRTTCLPGSGSDIIHFIAGLPQI